MSKVFQNIRCMVGMHKRSKRRVNYASPELRSVCRGCGQPMVKHGDHWEVDQAA